MPNNGQSVGSGHIPWIPFRTGLSAWAGVPWFNRGYRQKCKKSVKMKCNQTLAVMSQEG